MLVTGTLGQIVWPVGRTSQCVQNQQFRIMHAWCKLAEACCLRSGTSLLDAQQNHGLERLISAAMCSAVVAMTDWGTLGPYHHWHTPLTRTINNKNGTWRLSVFHCSCCRAAPNCIRVH